MKNTNRDSFFSLILGKLSWNSPPWLKYIQQQAKNRPRAFWGTALGIIAFLILIVAIFYWYSHLPKPILTTAQITQPQITPLADELIPDVLTLDFGTKEKGFIPKAVAPLNKIDKEIKEGITLTPAMPGKWVWQTDSHLIFTPSQDWPAGQEYTIHFDKKAFASHVKMESYSYHFSTRPFDAAISEYKFYQDPNHPNIKEAVATLQFNYPVDAQSLENNTTLLFQTLEKKRGEPLKYTVTYDKFKRTAYLHSQPITLTDEARYLELILNKGIKSTIGPSKTSKELSQNLLIPDMASYFKVENTSASIVRNQQDKPEQVLTIETSLGVKETNVNQHLHAYLLPQDHPATATEEAKINYEWTNPGEVTANILQLATPLNLQSIPADREFATLHSYQFSAQAPRYIYLKLDKGLKGSGDYSLTNDYSAVIKVPEYPKEISFLHKGSLLALSSDKKLSVITRGLPAVKFQISRVLPDDVNQLITQTQGDFSHPQFLSDNFNQQNISEIFSEIQSFVASDLSKEQYTALDLGKYLSAKTNTQGPRGLFLLHAVGWDVKKKIPLSTTADRLVLITDLGFLVKDNQDGTHDVFIQSITAGKPAANVQVSILGKNGLPILSQTTDAQGRAHFPTLKDFVDERQPVVYLAQLGNDVSFIPFNNTERQLNYSRFDTGGMYVNLDQAVQTLSAYVFSDRGIYRPGDLAHIGMIVKRAYAQSQPAGLPLEVVITDPRGTTVKDQKFTLDEFGYSTLDFQTNATSPTGQYTINLFIVQDNHPGSLLGSSTLKVAEFLPDRMRITAHLSKEQKTGWISPTDLSASVGLWNLYGAPAVDRKISAKILLTPQKIQFDAFPDYTFIDPLYDAKKPPKVFTDNLPDANTNDKGEAQFNLNLSRFDKATYQLTFYAEGFEAEGGRSVSTETSALVSPLDYFIGFKADGDLNYIKQNDLRHVNFIAINPALTKQAVSPLKLQLAALLPVTTLVKNPNGTYQYQSIIQTKIISTSSFAIDDKGVNYVLPTDQIGNFAISILDQNNVEISHFKYSVVGTSQLSLAKNAELNVKLNKTEYLPGETIEMQITAPYTGAGLITIERDKVYATQWFKTDATHSVQTIQIPKDFQGNGYVNVAFVRDWNSPDIFISPLSYRVVPFDINATNHAIHIDLSAPPLAFPGLPLNIQYKSDKPGKIIVYAVDEGILQVANYETPNPLAYFFQKYALEVVTQQTVDQILPKFILERELSAVGGDGGEGELKNYLNPFKRKTEAPVVYWSGILDTDSTMRQIVYNVPDYFNGNLRIMAVAAGIDAVGSTATSTIVRGNFVINPNVPTFVAPGDEFEITASIANNVKNSGDKAPIHVTLKTDQALDLLSPAQQTLTIGEDHEQTVRFKLRAKSLLGNSQLIFTANMGDKISKITSSLSVRPAIAFDTSVITGMSNDAKNSIKLNRDLYPEYRQVEAMMSGSPLILVYGLQRYLDNFPYGCTEQLVSKAFPLLSLTQQTWFEKNPRLLTEKIQNTIQMLSQRQMSNGGFSYWPSLGDYASNTFASVYAMHFLTEAKRLGYDIPNDMFHAGISYLKEVATGKVSSLEEARLQAYAIYILTRNDIVTTNYLTHLQLYLEKDTTKAWQQDLTSAYLAATYQLLKNYPAADKMIDYFKPQLQPTTYSYDFYNNNIAYAQYLYLLARHFPDRLTSDGKNLLMSLIGAMNKDDINTIFSSYASIALMAYGQVLQPTENTHFAISETLSNGKETLLTTLNNPYKKVALDNLVKQVNFQNPNQLNYFYQLTQAGYDKNIPKTALSQGIEVYREYRDAHDNVVTQANLGEELFVHIRLRSLQENYLNNIVVIDLLPGGFEVVIDSAKTDKMDYTDAREDRVVFFGSANPETKEIVYRIKATNPGQFTIPPIYANSMYDLKIRSHGIGDIINIKQ